MPTTAAEQLLNQAVEWRIRLVGVMTALGVVEGAIDPFAGGEMLAEVRAALARHENLSELAQSHLAAAEWRAALTALLVVADARLPPEETEQWSPPRELAGEESSQPVCSAAVKLELARNETWNEQIKADHYGN